MKFVFRLLKRLRPRPSKAATYHSKVPLHIQEALGAHKYTVILLHGRGCTGPEFAAALAAMSTSSPGLNLFSSLPGVRWVFPSAELQSGWFKASLRDPTFERKSLRSGLRSCVQYVQEVLEDEIRVLGGAAERVVLGGVSQGQAAALHVLLSSRCKLGAFVGACGWLPLAKKIELMGDVTKCLRKELGLGKDAQDDGLSSSSSSKSSSSSSSSSKSSSSLVGMPVFLGHGTFDTTVCVELGRQACSILRQMKMDVVWKEYVGAELEGHWLKEPEELDDIVDFLKTHLGIHTECVVAT